MTHAHETDEAALAAAAAMRMSLIVARRAAQRTLARVRAGAGAVGGARENAGLAAAWRREAVAARWAAADVLRDHDPNTAQAWDERVRDAGVDPDEARETAVTEEAYDTGQGQSGEQDTAIETRVEETAVPPRPRAPERGRWFDRSRDRGASVDPELAKLLQGFAVDHDREQATMSTGPEPWMSSDPDPGPDTATSGDGRGASSIVAEHLADAYTAEAATGAGAATPEQAGDPSAAQLIEITQSGQRDLLSSGQFTPEPGRDTDLGLDQARGRGEGLGR